MKRICSLLLALTLLTSLVGCRKANDDTTSDDKLEVDGVTFTETDETTNYVKIVFKGFGTVMVELSPSDAPLTVANFQKLVASGFYNGLTIHRVEPNFVIQGGDPKGNGTGGSGTAIKGEFAQNGVVNNLSHKRGVLSMARTNDPDSATSQFFVCLDSSTCIPSLDGKYAAFGWVISGMDVIDRIASVETYYTGGFNSPKEKVVITSMSFITPVTSESGSGADTADATSAAQSEE